MKDELARIGPGRPSERKAEVTAMLRFGGGLEVASGRVVVVAELDHHGAARRLQAALAQLYGHHSEIIVVSGRRRQEHYVVRVSQGAESLARQTGLLDARGRPVLGLPAALINGPVGDTQALWRGALLARGALSESGRSAALTIACPGFEAALALVGAARRLGLTAKAGQVDSVDRVIVRKASAIGALLSQLGADQTLAVWTQRQAPRAVRQPTSLGDANAQRSSRAGATAAARIERALSILGEDVPAHLKSAGELRLKYQTVSLEELGRLADPPLNKDIVAGRIRRLLVLADQRANPNGTPEGQPPDPRG